MKFNLLIDGKDYDIELRMGKAVTVWVGNETFQAEVKKANKGMKVFLNKKEFLVDINHSYVSINGHKHKIEVRNLRRGRPSCAHTTEDAGELERKKISGEGTIYPPMPGRVITIKVKEGDSVEIGSPILLLEAMKMQNEIVSPVNGMVKEVRVSSGSLVETGDILVVID